MKGFVRLAFIATLWTYLVIFLGGLVRVSGAGLGCPDWPQCFGRWFPPTNVSQLPPDMDPSLFNFALAWIEYINRLAGMTLGLVIAAVAVWGIVRYRKIPSLWIPSVLAGLTVAFLGWQGGQVIEQELHPLIVSVHMGLALFLASLMVYITVRSFRIESGGYNPSLQAAPMRYRVAILWFLAMTQMVFGARIRGGIETLAEQFPLLNAGALLSKVGGIAHLHYFIGAIILVAAVILVPWVLKSDSSRSPLVRQSAMGILHAGITQIILGSILVIAGIPQLMQLLHLWFAAIFIGLIVMTFASLSYIKEGAYGR